MGPILPTLASLILPEGQNKACYPTLVLVLGSTEVTASNMKSLLVIVVPENPCLVGKPQICASCNVSENSSTKSVPSS
jgi:hypothetical protein